MRYEIKGRVVDSFTGDGLAGVRVEAWDADFLFPDDFLNWATTRTDGGFTIIFDESAYRDLFLDKFPDIYFKVYCYSELLVSTENSIIWNVQDPYLGLEIKAPHPQPYTPTERHIYLKIERLERYCPVKPQEKVVPPVQYGRDCMRNHGHENGVIPQAEIDARTLNAVTYREYLDSGYLVPKPDKLIAADVNEPSYMNRVPGTVIYTRPGDRLKIHVWNTDDVPHSLHVHGLRYGIDSDGSWPFGTEIAHHGGRSDAICPGQTWTYTYDVPGNALGAWPFHDHTHHMFNKIDQGMLGGIVVLGPCDRPPRRFRFPWWLLERIYVDIGRLEKLTVIAEGEAAGKPPRGKKRAVKRKQHAHEVEPAGLPLHKLQEDYECIDECCCLELPPQIHARRLKPASREILHQHLDFLTEFALREMALLRPIVTTDHVPVFFHLMAPLDSRPVFDTNDIEELGGEAEITFDTAGDHEYFCRHHPEMTGTVHVVPGGPTPVTVSIVGGPPMGFAPDEITVGVGGTVTWINNSNFHHTVTSKQGAAMPTHCINGRGFAGNTPTIVGRSGQRIRWYVFNLDTSEAWHNFHPHAMRWRFGGESLDVRSMSPAESFVVESEIPPVLLLTDEEEQAQDPKHRPAGATLRQIKGEFMFHCHVHHHMMNGMIGLVRARQSIWLTDDMAHDIGHRTGLPLDDGSNACPAVAAHPCHHAGGRWEEVAGAPEVAFMHAVLLPNTQRVLYWGYTGDDQSRVWDHSTPAGSYMQPSNQPADIPGLTNSTSDMWSAAHALLDTAAGTALIHGGFSPFTSFNFDPATLTWSQVANTAGDRFYATTLALANGTVLTLYGNVKTYETYTHGAGWSAPVTFPAAMNHHQYYPWTYLLPDGRLFIAGPHDPTNRFNPAALGGLESFSTIYGNRSTGGEKGTSVLQILRPPDYAPIVCVAGGNLSAAEDTAEMIDLSSTTPAWSALPNLNLARAEQFTATLLPDGRIFIAGGISGGPDGGACEIFDPRSPADGWNVGPAMKYPRSYHSAFILLSDGSVLGGGDPQGPGGPYPHERYFPDYFDMMRPSISASPMVINYGTTFTVNTPNAADITEVILLRAGAVTHGFNMSQRGLECEIASFAAGSIDAEMPANANLAPPGWYLLFILNANRVPSEGRWVRVTP